jgi:hypothetical protein
LAVVCFFVCSFPRIMYSATRLTSNMPFTIDKSCYLAYGPVYVFLFELDVQLSDFFLEKLHPPSRRNENSKTLSNCKFLTGRVKQDGNCWIL